MSRQGGGNIGRRTRNSQLVHNYRLNRSAEDQLTDIENVRNQTAITRANESQEQRNKRRRANIETKTGPSTSHRLIQNTCTTAFASVSRIDTCITSSFCV